MRIAPKTALAMVLGVALLSAQQNVPDAPSATRPPQPAPTTQYPSAPEPQNNTAPPAPPPAQQPAPKVTPVLPGQLAPVDPNSRDEALAVIRKVVSQVVIPVTVKDSSGRLVAGLTKDDFSVYENDKEQKVNVFTSDPFPISAAIVLDVGMPEPAVRKVNDTMSALVGAFSQFDELAFFTFGTQVEKKVDFSAVTDRLATTLKRLKPRGQPAGVPVTGGPMASGPTINGEPVDPSRPHVNTPRRDSRVLNDAILAAAMELARHDKTKSRRKMIFVISDGREYGSRAGYSEVLKVLLSNDILLYAVAVDDAALPIYRKLETAHLPASGYGNILPKYANATGGEVFPEFNLEAIESAYSRLTEEARNQYTLGYQAPRNASNSYRSIEVVVHRPNLMVHAKTGYYPLPIAAP